VLVLGGARSGKSEFAEKYVLHSGQRCGYIATAEVLDEEMKERVALHKKRRGGRWTTFEAPYEAEKAISGAADECDAFLFDDVTIYLANLLYGRNMLEGGLKEKMPVVREKIDGLLKAARGTGKTFVMVSNEVGCSIVPENAMAREYRDIAGWVNQQIGNEADEVYLVVAGQAVDVKRLAFKFED